MGKETVKSNSPRGPDESLSASTVWERFERAVDAAVKSGPKHRTAKEQAKVQRPTNQSPATLSKDKDSR